MIVFLTLCYCAVLWLLVALKVLKPTFLVKLSPLLWAALLFVVLFIPLQFAAPAGEVVVWQPVTLMSGRVSGRVTRVHVQANEPVEKDAELVQIDPEPYALEVKRLEAALAEAKQQVPQLKASLDAAKASVVRAKKQVTFAGAELDRLRRLTASGAGTAEEADKWRRDLDVAQASVREAQALEEKARLAYDAKTADGENVTVAQIKAQLEKARYDLKQTTVRAPAAGRVVNLQLQEGSSMAVGAGNPMLAFVPDVERYAVVSVAENFLRHVQPGQEAEVSLDYYPGRILKGRVDQVVRITGEGQFAPTQTNLPEVAKVIHTGGRFAVRIKLDEGQGLEDLPVGAGGKAAVYTEQGKPTHVLRRVMLRMDAWMNYLF